ncbi:MAG: IS66 family transposase, partial [Terriglobia bacterium]
MTCRPDLSQCSHTEKDTLIYALLDQVEALRSEVAALRAETAGLRRRLGMNSSNSGKPPSSDGLKKPSRVNNQREKTGKKSGGQKGHEGKTLRQAEKLDQVANHVPSSCAGCGGTLGLEHATAYQKRQVFDLPEPRPIEVTEHRAHSCRCPGCGATTVASFPDDVTGATQYGANITALVVYLQSWQLMPEDRLAELMRDVFGIEIATATIAAMAQKKAAALDGLAAFIGEQVRRAGVKHMDETGYRIAGTLQWLHVASTALLTFYRTSRKRGSLLEGVAGIIVHDFWRPYFTMGGVTHALCNAHHLRELKALIEIEKEPWATDMRRFLRHACHAVNLAGKRGSALKPAFIAWLSARYDRILAQGFQFHEGQPPLTASGLRRGRVRRRTGHNLLI